MIEIITNGKNRYFFHRDLEKDLSNAVKTFNEEMHKLPTLLREYKFPLTSDYVRGLYTSGISYVIKQTEQEIDEMFKDKPGARFMLANYKKMATDAIPTDFKDRLNAILSNARSGFASFSTIPTEAELDLKDGKLTLKQSFVDAELSRCQEPITDELVQDCDQLVRILAELRALNDKGYNVVGYTTANYLGQAVRVPGLVESYAGHRYDPENRTELNRDAILVQMHSKALTKEQREAMFNKVEE